MRAIWTGSISFGLINIPVKVYSGAETRDGLDLHMLHNKDNSPIRYAKICKEEDKEVPFDEIVKGFEFRKGEFVILTDEDFENADAKKTSTIDIVEFTGEEQIDARYLERPYYLEPAKGAEKAYTLLREALKKSNKLAVSKFVLRQREHLAAIKPVGQVLILNQLRYPADLRSPGGLKLPTDKPDKRELDVALAFIDKMTEPFIPEDFHDTYTEELEAAIEAKVAGKPAPTATAAASSKPTQDLMAALKASLEAADKK
jgi:DNA end-binding protein Ku